MAAELGYEKVEKVSGKASMWNRRIKPPVLFATLALFVDAWVGMRDIGCG